MASRLPRPAPLGDVRVGLIEWRIRPALLLAVIGAALSAQMFVTPPARGDTPAYSAVSPGRVAAASVVPTTPRALAGASSSQAELAKGDKIARVGILIAAALAWMAGMAWLVIGRMRSQREEPERDAVAPGTADD